MGNPIIAPVCQTEPYPEFCTTFKTHDITSANELGTPRIVSQMAAEKIDVEKSDSVSVCAHRDVMVRTSCATGAKPIFQSGERTVSLTRNASSPWLTGWTRKQRKQSRRQTQNYPTKARAKQSLIQLYPRPLLIRRLCRLTIKIVSMWRTVRNLR